MMEIGFFAEVARRVASITCTEYTKYSVLNRLRPNASSQQHPSVHSSNYLSQYGRAGPLTQPETVYY